MSLIKINESAPTVSLHLCASWNWLFVFREDRKLPVGTQKGTSETTHVFPALARTRLNMSICLGNYCAYKINKKHKPVHFCLLSTTLNSGPNAQMCV